MQHWLRFAKPKIRIVLFAPATPTLSPMTHIATAQPSRRHFNFCCSIRLQWQNQQITLSDLLPELMNVFFMVLIFFLVRISLVVCKIQPIFTHSPKPLSDASGSKPSLKTSFLLPAHNGCVKSVGASGRWVASGSSDEVIRFDRSSQSAQKIDFALAFQVLFAGQHYGCFTNGSSNVTASS